jgi:hypothetical protein
MPTLRFAPHSCIVVVISTWLLSGCAAGAGGGGGGGIGGAPGTPCTPGAQGEGCFGQSLVVCDAQGSVWKETGSCTSSQVCATSGFGAASVAFCQKTSTGGPQAPVYAGVEGQACEVGVDFVGCDPAGNVSTCKQDGDAATWQPIANSDCENRGYPCVSGMCGGLPVAYCAYEGESFSCPGVLSAGTEGQSCNPKVDVAGCDPAGSVSTCKQEGDAATWQPIANNDCENRGYPCVSGMCGGLPVAYCAYEGQSFSCPGVLSAGTEGQSCDPKVDVVGCDPYGNVSTCKEDGETAVWQPIANEDCENRGYKCVSGMCGAVPIAKCVDVGEAFSCK